MTKATLYVVVEGIEEDVRRIQDELKELLPDPSFSPCREQASLNNCIEFYATWQAEKGRMKEILDQLDNDWSGEEGDYDAYGFNTKMFDKKVYYLRADY